MINDIKIGSRLIGVDHPPYIIAEMSANHNGSFERALKIIKAAKESGADAVKLQTYTADSMTLNIDHPRFKIEGDNPWDGEYLYDLYKKASTPYEWHPELFAYGAEVGISIFSSPFDNDAVNLLEKLNTPIYKIASFELVDHDLIRLCANTGKPLIMSTGMASLDEITEAVGVAREAGANDIVLLKCTSAYPAPVRSINLKTIKDLEGRFKLHTGLSDHTMGIGVAVAAAAIGASVIEKHFTLARSDGGVDSSFSLEPDELRQLVDETKNAHYAIGKISYTQENSESSFKKYRRSLFFVKDLEAGKKITDKDLKSLRPGDGLPPKFKESIIGRELKESVTNGTPVSWNLLKGE
jgi:pseudaminic acid synthase